MVCVNDLLWIVFFLEIIFLVDGDGKFILIYELRVILINIIIVKCFILYMYLFLYVCIDIDIDIVKY